MGKHIRIGLALFLLLGGMGWYALDRAESAFLEIHKNWRVDRKNHLVYFRVQNRTNVEISKFYGWVYGFNKEDYPDFELVNNPHRAPIKVTPGPHRPGASAVYRFTLIPDKNKKRFYGLLVYDRSVFYNQNP